MEDGRSQTGGPPHCVSIGRGLGGWETGMPGGGGLIHSFVHSFIGLSFIHLFVLSLLRSSSVKHVLGTRDCAGCWEAKVGESYISSNTQL